MTTMATSQEKLDRTFDTEKDAGSLYETPKWSQNGSRLHNRLAQKLLSWGVEERGASVSVFDDRLRVSYPCEVGILPVQPEERTDTHYSKIFFIWLSFNFNILSCVVSCFLDFLTSQMIPKILCGHIRPRGLRPQPARLMSRYLILQSIVQCFTCIFVSGLVIQARINRMIVV